MIGGILSSTALTLLVLPLLYRIAHRRDEGEETEDAREHRHGAPLDPAPGFTDGPIPSSF